MLPGMMLVGILVSSGMHLYVEEWPPKLGSHTVKSIITELGLDKVGIVILVV